MCELHLASPEFWSLSIQSTLKRCIHLMFLFFTAYMCFCIIYINIDHTVATVLNLVSEQHIFVQDAKFVTKQRKISSAIHVTFFFFGQ